METEMETETIWRCRRYRPARSHIAVATDLYGSEATRKIIGNSKRDASSVICCEFKKNNDEKVNHVATIVVN